MRALTVAANSMLRCTLQYVNQTALLPMSNLSGIFVDLNHFIG